MVLNWRVLVPAVQQDSWGVLNLGSTSVSSQDFFVPLNTNVNVTELDLASSDSLDSGNTLPLNCESFAASAAWVNVGNNPDVLSVSDHSGSEGLNIEAIEPLPLGVVFPNDMWVVSVVDRWLVNGLVDRFNSGMASCSPVDRP